MNIILSRKGFDSSAGGCPSPILPDGSMISLPIPDRQSPIHYGDIRWHQQSLGRLVSDLTRGRIPASHRAHLDPDLAPESLPRADGWRPLLGQTGSAQGHLRNHQVAPGDLLLFFGLFRRVTLNQDRWTWCRQSPPCHVLWGWLNIARIVEVDQLTPKDGWARYHPHCHGARSTNNTLYIADELGQHDVLQGSTLSGAGIFPRFSPSLVLTAPGAPRPSHWRLPGWFQPRPGASPLSYHADPQRWRRLGEHVLLDAAARGQEFVLHADEYPEAITWVRTIFQSTSQA